MSYPLKPPALIRPAADDLAALAAAINQDHEAGIGATRRGLECFRAAGERLLHAKQLVGHGGWLKWLETHVRFTDRQARKYMKLAREWDRVKSELSSDLGLTDALRLLTNDTDGLAPVVAQSAGRVMEAVRQEWQDIWQRAGVWFPASSADELREWFATHLGDGVGSDATTDWKRLLDIITAELAARHLLRTGELLPCPPRPPARTVRAMQENRNAEAGWAVRVQYEAGGFLNWCDAVGISLEGRLRFPDPPDLDKLKAALLAEFEGDAKPDPAEVLGVTSDGLPQALVDWMRGHVYAFLGVSW